MKTLIKRLASMTLLLASACWAMSASSGTLNFDDLSDFQRIGNNYGGINWTNFFALDTTILIRDKSNIENSGFVKGLVTPNNVIFNFDALPAEFSSPTPFIFNSVYLTAAWNNDLNIQVTGFREEVQVESKNLLLNPDSPTLITFNWINVDRV